MPVLQLRTTQPPVDIDSARDPSADLTSRDRSTVVSRGSQEALRYVHDADLLWCFLLFSCMSYGRSPSISHDSIHLALIINVSELMMNTLLYYRAFLMDNLRPFHL